MLKFEGRPHCAWPVASYTCGECGYTMWNHFVREVYLRRLVYCINKECKYGGQVFELEGERFAFRLSPSGLLPIDLEGVDHRYGP